MPLPGGVCLHLLNCISSKCQANNCVSTITDEQQNYTVTTATKRLIYINCSIILFWLFMLLLCNFVVVMSSQPYAWLYMSSWPDVVLLLTTRCLYWGYICIFSIAFPQNVKPTLCMTVHIKLTWHSTALGHQMPLLGRYLSIASPPNVKPTLCMTVNVKLTWHSTALGHKMPLLRGTSAFFNWFQGWLLHHRGLFYKRPIKDSVGYTPFPSAFASAMALLTSVQDFSSLPWWDWPFTSLSFPTEKGNVWAWVIWRLRVTTREGWRLVVGVVWPQ